MLSTPLKTIEKLWDKTAKARLPVWLKAILLTIDNIALLVYSFWFFILVDRATLVIDKVADLLRHFLGLP
jgi:hypothetical protein